MPDSAGAVAVDITTGKNEVKPALQSLGGAAKSAARSIAKGLGAAIGAASLAKFSAACIDAASSAQQTANRVATVFPKMQAQVNAFASTAMERMGMGAGTAKSVATQFGMMAQGMGFSEKAAAEMSTAMTRLTGDMAAFYGISADDAQAKLSGVFTGMTRGMKTLGVNMSEANLQQHALSLGVSKSVSKMSDAELAALRLSYAQSQLSRTSGYAQRNLGTWAGQTAYLNQQAAKLRSTIGQGLIAAMLPLVKVMNTVIALATRVAEAFNRMIEAVTGKKLDKMLGGAAGGVVELSDASDTASESTDDLASAQKSAAKAAKAQEKAQKALNRTLAGFDKINKLTTQKTKKEKSEEPQTTGLGLAPQIAAASGFGKELAEANKQVGKLQAVKLPEPLISALQRLGTAAGKFAELVKKGLGWVWDNVLVPLGKWTMKEVAPRVVNILAAALDVLTEVCKALAPVFKAMWEVVFKPLAKLAGKAITAMLDGICDGLRGIAKFAQDHPKVFKAIVVGLTGLLIIRKARMVNLLGKLGSAFKALFGVFSKNPIGIVITAIALAAGLIYKNWDKIKKTKIGKALAKLGKALEPVGKLIGDVIAAAIEKIAGLIKKIRKAGKPIFDKLGKFAKNAAKVLGDVLAGAISGLADMITGIGKAWNGIKEGTKVLVAEAKEKVAGAIQAIKDGWEAIKDKGAELVATAKNALGTAWDKIKEAWAIKEQKTAEMVATVKNALGTAWDKIKEAWAIKEQKTAELVATVKEKVAGALAAIKDGWGAVKDKTAELTAKAKDAMGTAWTNIKEAWAIKEQKTAELVAKARNAMGNAWTNIRSAFGSLKDKTATLTGKAKSALGGAWKKMKSAWDWLNNKKAELTAKFTDSFSKPLKKAWNAVAGAINKGIDVINKIPKVNIPHVPTLKLAQGGYVGRNTPRLAVIGDNTREGEIVSPESKFQSMLDKASGSGSDMSVVEGLLRQLIAEVRSKDGGVYLDGRMVARAVVSHVNRQTQATGRCPIMV